jgi:hypothetical protein
METSAKTASNVNELFVAIGLNNFVCLSNLMNFTLINSHLQPRSFQRILLDLLLKRAPNLLFNQLKKSQMERKSGMEAAVVNRRFGHSL